MTSNKDTKLISPKAFLKNRRPERFSDSLEKVTGTLDRPILEYQLSTLNTQSKELQFETFSKKLIEKTVCPNLLEQTGPVAGGDGKVDTQTFPVSEQNKLLWYVGVNKNSNSDRWAFAISTQKTWKQKCKTDIRKILKVDRNYKKAFFISNQTIKANFRSELEDELTKETKIDVRIFDLSWILDQVFSNKLEQLAIDTLNIETEWKREIKIGVNDYSKKQRVSELNEKINNEINLDNVLPEQINWFLEIAIISKELEAPLVETTGLFDRAVNIAEKHGNYHQKFKSHYQYAWAAYWWFEKINLFQEQLLKCFKYAKIIGQSEIWGDFVSLLGLLITLNKNQKSLINVDSLIEETKEILREISQEDERPSNSIMAKAHIETINLYIIDNKDTATDIFENLLHISKEAERLIGFPFESLYSLINELDDVFYDNESYEKYLDYLTEQYNKRNDELSSSLLWLKRGVRRYDSGQPYQAIKLIGKSLTGLYKDESKRSFCGALFFLANAYQKVGLIWAARANLLQAASVVTDDFWKSGDAKSMQVFVYVRLAYIEIKLGRLNYSLSWWELACLINYNLTESAVGEEDIQNYDAAISQAFLNTEFLNISRYATLPDFVDRYGLFFSRSVLLYILGYESIVEKEYELSIDDGFIETLIIARDSDIGIDIVNPKFYDGRYIQLKSYVIGCDISISFPFRTPLVELSETILAIIEGFLSTAIIDDFFVFEPQLVIEIIADDDDDICISHEIITTESTLRIEITCSSFTLNMLNIEGQKIISDWLFDFIIQVFAHIGRPKNPEKTLEDMIVNDKAFERSISFGSCFIGQKNIMGVDAVSKIKSLASDSTYKRYDPTRQKAWDIDFPATLDTKEQKGKGTPKKEGSLDKENMSHKDFSVKSLFKIRLWEKVNWRGSGFTLYPDGIPGLIILLEDSNGLKELENDFINELGERDIENRIRISIIKDIDKSNPNCYRVVLSENPINESKEQLVQYTLKINTMTPDSNKNLEGFLNAYKEKGCFYLSFADLNKINQNMMAMGHNKILINKLNLFNAWEISTQDPELSGVYLNDEVYIPSVVINPPILQVFGLLKNIKK